MRVPEGSLVRSAEAAWEEAQDIGVPVVVKPYDGSHGRRPSFNLMTEADVKAAYELAARKGDEARPCWWKASSRATNTACSWSATS